MSNEVGPNRWVRTVVSVIATLAIAITPIALAAPAGAAVPAKPTCTAGATPVLYQGQWYCPGTAAAVKKTAYGKGKRILLAGVSVTAIRGTTATVSSTTITSPSCPPNMYCGATVTITVTTVTVSLGALAAAARPAVGAYGDFYGVTGTGILTATGFVRQSSVGVCTDPDFC